MQNLALVSTSRDLLQAIAKLQASDFVALDTEFIRESTYYPKLCLIQAATLEHCVLIDPLALQDLSALWTFLADRNRIKVLHAARQDLEVISLSLRGERLPGPIFDTQIAGALLGSPAQAGYGALVAERLGVTLTKGAARTDWTRRPLSEEQSQYAADDVRYLAPLYTHLRDALVTAGRLDWLYEETRELENPEGYRVAPDDAWRRLKGLDRLQPAQRAAVKLLAAWRESMAVEHDKPRGWILTDEALRELAERLPASAAELERVPSVPPAVLRKRGELLLRMVEQARELAHREPQAFTPTRPEPAQLALVNRLMAFVRARAAQLRISPELLATRRDVERLVFSERTDRVLSGWRREAIGEPLLSAARGD